MEQTDIIARLEAIEEKLTNGAIWELPSVLRSISWLIADVEDRGCACGSSPPGFVGQDGIHCGCCDGILKKHRKISLLMTEEEADKDEWESFHPAYDLTHYGSDG